MIKKTDYEYLLQNYGMVASWAIWALPGSKPKSNMRDVSFFESENILQELNPHIAFIGLNGSTGHDNYMDCDKPWHNFHSSAPHGNDYKLRYAVMNTPFWGAYITDAIVDYSETDSTKVSRYLTDHSEIISQNMKRLKDEFSHLANDLTIIALGDKSFSLINREFGNSYCVLQIPHYSYTGINKEQYRSALNELQKKYI